MPPLIDKKVVTYMLRAELELRSHSLPALGPIPVGVLSCLPHLRTRREIGAVPEKNEQIDQRLPSWSCRRRLEQLRGL